ncbi:hypothetical protein K0M31_007751 [Melipona bicolor]|uniref:Uncharacterized protein n=1 Tax=Melipona bicolor TaxID=60889 RepID=A0AA40KVY1_9HYME|nr:hypothetical protein K0M31_007751 [Melipona bicolor]
MSLGSFAKYNINWYQLPATKKIMDKIKRDVEMAHGEALEILKKHAYMAKICGLRFGSTIVLYYSSIFIYERIVPTNESRLRRFPISTEYLILGEKCRLLPFLHINISVIIGITIFTGTEMLTILCLKHAIALSEVTSCYVKETIFRNSKYQCDERTRKDIAKAVIAHKRGLEYIQEIQDHTAFTYAVLLLFAVSSLAINLFRFALHSHLSKRETPESKILFIFQLSASLSKSFSSEFEEKPAIAITTFPWQCKHSITERYSESVPEEILPMISVSTTTGTILL